MPASASTSSTPIYYMPTTVPAAPATYHNNALYGSYGSWQSVPVPQTVPVMQPDVQHTQPLYVQPVQYVQQVQLTQPQLYYINNAPYYCYPAQPDILHPVYVYQPQYTQTPEQPQTQASLENYVKQMEQQQQQQQQCDTYC